MDNLARGRAIICPCHITRDTHSFTCLPRDRTLLCGSDLQVVKSRIAAIRPLPRLRPKASLRERPEMSVPETSPLRLQFDPAHAEVINGAVETFLAVHSTDGTHRLTAKVSTEGRPHERRVRLALAARANNNAQQALVAQTSLPLRWLMTDRELVHDALLQALRDGHLLRALQTATP